MENSLTITDYHLKDSQNNVSKYLELVIGTLLSNDYSTHTRKAILSDLKHFIEWYSKKNSEPFSFQRTLPMDITDYREETKQHLSPSTINRRLVTLRRFFATAQELELIEKNPADKVKQLAVQGLAPKSLDATEVRRFLKEVELRGNLRDKVAIYLMLSGGLRASEVISLRPQDIEITERKGIATIRHAKGNKTRKVPLHANLRAWITDYLKVYGIHERLLIGQRGCINQLALNYIVGKYARKAEVKASCHTLRHTFAYKYLEQNAGDIVGLAQLLGHDSVNTSMIYTQHREEQLAERVEAISF